MMTGEDKRQRDEWKAKAERSNNGVKRSITNLEWFYRNNLHFEMYAEWWVVMCGIADDTDAAYEWLMSEHVDTTNQPDGGPDAPETAGTDETDDENAPETPDFVENPQKTGFQGTENARNADELPEGDSVGIMYRALNNQNSPTFCALLRYLGISNGISASWDEAEDALRMLADMVERDYVRWEGMYDEVLAERNEWKARAEGAGSIELRACQSNLEWLMENESQFSHSVANTAFETVHDAPYSPLDTLAWLMSEHVDANGTCPDMDGTPSNVDGTPSDAGDCGQIADMSGKRPDCVHDESEMSEVGSEVGSKLDTREKLEADVRCCLMMFGGCLESKFREGKLGTDERLAQERAWFPAFANALDRQAAITERESHYRIEDLSHDCEMWRDRAEDMRMERDALELEKAELVDQLDEYRDAFDFAKNLERRVKERYVLDLWGVRYVPKEWYDEARDAPDTDGMDRVGLRATIDSLKDELAASRRELKMARGELSVTLNNWEQAKGKLDRRKAELDGRERMLRERGDRSAEEPAGETVDALRAELAAAEGEREEYRSRLGRVLDGLEAIRKQEAM